jgi:hypothetical protein
VTDISIAWHDVWAWGGRYDATLDMIVVWALFVGSLIMAIAKFIAWETLRGTTDVERLGRSLKRQKLSESFIWSALSLLYAMTLAEMYGYQSAPHERMSIRVALVVTIVVATYYVLRFIRDLRREPPETINERDLRQTATDIRQAARDVVQDQRERDGYPHG